MAPVMYWALRTTLCSALRSEAEQLPYQAVMQPIRVGGIRKFRIQLQREVFSPRVLSLLMSFEGTMVLNAEL